MQFLFKAADRYLEESDWKTLALIKFCLCAMGVMLGCNVPQNQKKGVTAGAAVVFTATYIPLMAKLFGIFQTQVRENAE